jgi:hypothetical protein
LEKRRRCGWLSKGAEDEGPPVWARNGVAVATCPKSFITAESTALLEEFLTRRLLRIDPKGLSARQVDAYLVLEKAILAEARNGQHNSENVV